MLRPERHEEIVRHVLRRGTASVVALAALLNVSEITIRRDLDELDRLGRLRRIRGGAQRSLPRDHEPPVVHRRSVQAAEKQAIGLAAVDLVRDGDVIGIESGSTSLELARAIAAHSWESLDVVTNSFLVVGELARVSGVRLIFVGGSVNHDEMGTFGSMAEDALKRINIDKLFMTCRGIDPDAGITNDTKAEATFAAERSLVRASRLVLVLADHTKIGRVFPLQSVPIDMVHTVVTDGLAPPELVQALRSKDVQVIMATPSGATDSGDTRAEG